MSDWEEVPDNNIKNQEKSNSSDWEEYHETKNEKINDESLLGSLIKSPFRIGEDIYRGGMSVAKAIPKYYESSKTAIPSAIQDIQQNPLSSMKQGIAGFGEAGKNVFNMPHDLINYLSKRLNLMPEKINEKVQMSRMPEDTEEMINETLGSPKNEGESLIRGSGRNAMNLIGSSYAARMLNPMNLTAKSIAKDILKEEKNQIKIHNKSYKQIWNESEKSGFDSVPIDYKLINNKMKTIKKYKTPKEFESVNELLKNPTLENAQKAQSDMGVIKRSLEKKSRKSSLTSEENKLYDAAKDTEKHIEDNMFKNKKGEINDNLKKKYNKVTNSYRENVVPYKYNKNIQAYKNQEMLPKDLVNSLSHGEFAVKKGKFHPEIAIRNIFKNHPYLTGAGAMGLGNAVYNNIFGNNTPKQ